METGAIKDYTQMKNLNMTKCGLTIHPDAVLLGASADGLLCGHLERPSFGLVGTKCPNVHSYIDSKYFTKEHGKHTRKQSPACYWQVQGQLLVTGMEWYDFKRYV